MKITEGALSARRMAGRCVNGYYDNNIGVFQTLIDLTKIGPSIPDACVYPEKQMLAL